MPSLNHSSFIKGTAARYNGARGNLLLSADGLWFVPDDGGSEIHLPIENIMDASLEGVVRKRVCVVLNGSNDRHVFSVTDYDSWKESISLAAGIYRRIVTGTSGTGSQLTTTVSGGSTVQPAQPQKPARQRKNPSQRKANPTPAASTPPPAATSATVAPASRSKSATASSPAYTGPWPSGQDYEQSFQMMKVSLNPKVGEVSNWDPVKNPKTPGWFVYASGNYGSIYKIKEGSDKYIALKCFTRNSANLNERYLKISDYLSNHANGINFLAHFRYFEEGIRTRKSQSFFFPVLKMEWMDGVTLNKYIQSNINDTKTLKNISTKLLSEIKKLQDSGISHGDLAGDNIIVAKGGEVKLVDYDGMFIPDFKGMKSTEMGHADFQHPGRTADSFSATLDNFSALVLHLSLTAIASRPELWDKYNGGDPDCLILRKKDFLNLDISPAFKEISSIRNKKVKKMCNLLKEYLKHGPLWEGASPSVLLSL